MVGIKESEKALWEGIFKKKGVTPSWKDVLYHKGIEWLMDAFNRLDHHTLRVIQSMPSTSQKSIFLETKEYDIIFSEFWPLAIEYYKAINPIYNMKPIEVFDKIVNPAHRGENNSDILKHIMKSSEIIEDQKQKNER